MLRPHFPKSSKRQHSTELLNKNKSLPALGPLSKLFEKFIRHKLPKQHGLLLEGLHKLFKAVENIQTLLDGITGYKNKWKADIEEQKSQAGQTFLGKHL